MAISKRIKSVGTDCRLLMAEALKQDPLATETCLDHLHLEVRERPPLITFGDFSKGPSPVTLVIRELII